MNPVHGVAATEDGTLRLSLQTLQRKCAELRELLDEQALPSDDESVQRLRAMLVDAGLGEGT